MEVNICGLEKDNNVDSDKKKRPSEADILK